MASLVRLGRLFIRLGELFLHLGELESSSALPTLVLPSFLSAPLLFDFHSLSTKHCRIKD